jgi:hypothetical protein
MAKKKARFKKGSAAAKAFMAKLRSMQGGKRRKTPVKRISRKTLRQKMNTPWSKPAVTRSEASAEKALNILRNRGRRIAKSAGIKPFFFTGKKPQLVVSEGDFMAKRRTSKRRKARISGFDGQKRRSYRRTYHGGRRRSRRGVLMGGIGNNIPKLLTQGAAGAAGAIASAFIASRIPGVPPKFKPAIPFAVAIALMTAGKKVPMAPALAFGCAVAGAMGFVKQFAPSIPLLAGVESAPELSAEDVELLGAPQTFGAVQELAGAVSPADL